MRGATPTKAPTPWQLNLGHRDGITQVAFAPQSEAYVSASRDGHVVWREAATGKVLRTFKGSRSVSAVALSPDGALLAAGGANNHIVIWETESGNAIATLSIQAQATEEEQSGITSLAFARDGKTLAAGAGGSIRIMEWRANKQRLRIAAGQEIIRKLVFTPEGALLCANATGEVQSCNVETGAPQPLGGEKRPGAFGAFSPDGRQMAFFAGRRIALWSVEKNAQTVTMTAPRDVASVAFSPDGKRLIGALHPNLLVLWNTDKGEIVQAVESGTGLSAGDVATMELSPDGKWLVAGSAKGLVRVWDAATTALKTDLPGFVLKTTALATGLLPGSGPAGAIIAAYSDGTLRVWDAGSGKLQKTLSYPDHFVRCLALAPGGKTLALCYDWNAYSSLMITQGVAYQEVQLLDTTTWNARQTIKIADYRSPVTSLKFSPDGALLAAGTTFPSQEDTVRVWNSTTGALQFTLGQDENLRPINVAFSGDGKWIGARSDSGYGLQVWDMVTKTPQLINRHGASASVGSLLFLPGNKQIAVANRYGLSLWDIESRKWLPSVEKVSEPSRQIALASNGSLLATSVAGGAKLWALPDWRFKGYVSRAYEVADIAFGADNRSFATANTDGAIRLWNCDTLELLATLQTLPGAEWISFTPRGYFAASPTAAPWLDWQGKAAAPEYQNDRAVAAALQAK